MDDINRAISSVCKGIHHKDMLMKKVKCKKCGYPVSSVAGYRYCKRCGHQEVD